MSDDTQQKDDTHVHASGAATDTQEDDLVTEEQKNSQEDAHDDTESARQDGVHAATEDKAEEYLHGWRRAKADYENLKKEVDRERREMGTFARAMAAMDFIPIYDNFKKAAAHEPALSESEGNKPFKQWMEGIQHIKSQFKDVLKQVGIEEIPTVGAPFDPRVHEAVEEREGAGVPPGQIIAELSGGYKMGDRVLQAAKVIIAK